MSHSSLYSSSHNSFAQYQPLSESFLSTHSSPNAPSSAASALSFASLFTTPTTTASANVSHHRHSANIFTPSNTQQQQSQPKSTDNNTYSTFCNSDTIARSSSSRHHQSLSRISSPRQQHRSSLQLAPEFHSEFSSQFPSHFTTEFLTPTSQLQYLSQSSTLRHYPTHNTNHRHHRHVSSSTPPLGDLHHPLASATSNIGGGGMVDGGGQTCAGSGVGGGGRGSSIVPPLCSDSRMAHQHHHHHHHPHGVINYGAAAPICGRNYIAGANCTTNVAPSASSYNTSSYNCAPNLAPGVSSYNCAPNLAPGEGSYRQYNMVAGHGHQQQHQATIGRSWTSGRPYTPMF